MFLPGLAEGLYLFFVLFDLSDLAGLVFFVVGFLLVIPLVNLLLYQGDIRLLYDLPQLHSSLIRAVLVIQLKLSEMILILELPLDLLHIWHCLELVAVLQMLLFHPQQVPNASSHDLNGPSDEGKQL